jgi:hypothetical protein
MAFEAFVEEVYYKLWKGYNLERTWRKIVNLSYR